MPAPTTIALPVQVVTPATGIDREQRDRIVLENLPLVRGIALRVRNSLPVHVDLDDLIHAGVMGLMDAAAKFSLEKNVAFSTYAKHRIKGAILDSLRQADLASRDLRRRTRQVETITNELMLELGHAPTDEQIADRMGLDLMRFRQLRIDMRNVESFSASSRAQLQEDLPEPECPAQVDVQPDYLFERVELKEKLKVAVGGLPPKYQSVVSMYYTNEMTMKEIGGALGINESRVSQIHKAALKKMAVSLENSGISSLAAIA